MTKLIYRSHTWWPGPYISLSECRSDEDGSRSVIVTVHVSGQRTQQKLCGDIPWNDALAALPQALVEFGIDPKLIDVAPTQKAYHYDVGDGVEQELRSGAPTTKGVYWKLQCMGRNAGSIDGASPTWDEAIEDSLKVLPKFKALLKEVEGMAR